jgi:NAD(P)-dependent dehydrogenase (short-subunit alcohol dehydrogenase family)
MPITYDMLGKVAVVTGGANGIGRGVAERLQQAGASVWIWDTSPCEIAGIRSARVDVTDGEQIGRAIKLLLAEDPGIDILVNSAGFTGGSASVEEYDPAQWRHIVEVNLVGVYEVSRQVVPVMRSAAWGRIVNIASLAGKEGTPFLSAYSAAKAGVIAFTKSLAKELADTEIRVNSVAPAAIKTDLIHQVAPEVLAAMIAKSPLKRLGTVDEVTDLVLWLSSEACSFNTGAVFDLSGGRATY